MAEWGLQDVNIEIKDIIHGKSTVCLQTLAFQILPGVHLVSGNLQQTVDEGLTHNRVLECRFTEILNRFYGPACLNG